MSPDPKSPRQGACEIEVVAFNVAALGAGSTIAGKEAKPTVHLAVGLETGKVLLGYRVFAQGRIIERSSINGNEMSWSDSTDFQIGASTLEVPEAAVLHCIVSYYGQAQSHAWVGDPSTSQNPRRAAYTAFDEGLAILKDFLGKTGRGRDARDLEAATSWLLWMLGFDNAHLGGTARTQAAADLIATTPSGQFAVIECTTGTLRADNKLPLLVQRAEAVRANLDASSNQHLRVLPVIVTSLSREEVRADLEQAQKLGVAVVTRETLERAIDRTLVFPDADRIYTEVEDQLLSNDEQENDQGSFEL